MSNVAITGGTRGIGHGLAREFVARSHAVTISGRDQATVDAAVERLRADFPSGDVHGVVCDVRSIESVERMWDAARERAQAEGLVALALATEKNNTTAKALYESLGYELDTAFDYYELTL